ncbi:hypothetical protein HPB50_015189 [Hyalomma asiaticum]|uniref:Uncharacterized protein n=1 Tax=Hyalomma asiaticum TaxID=266040 RepID=A0ACB7SR63_HYAAI|nr:hypothetical protein HPB50_015189 [Hyalomma asiaticum]
MMRKRSEPALDVAGSFRMYGPLPRHGYWRDRGWRRVAQTRREMSAGCACNELGVAARKGEVRRASKPGAERSYDWNQREVIRVELPPPTLMLLLFWLRSAKECVRACACFVGSGKRTVARSAAAAALFRLEIGSTAATL